MKNSPVLFFLYKFLTNSLPQSNSLAFFRLLFACSEVLFTDLKTLSENHTTFLLVIRQVNYLLIRHHPEAHL